MSKEYLELLGKEIRYQKEYVGNDIYRLYIKKNEIELLEKYLTELQAIKSVEPSEALNKLLDRANHDEYLARIGKEEALKFLNENQMFVASIKQALLKAQEQKKENDELKKVLSIIKEKDVNIWYLAVSTKVKNYKDYNSFLMNDKNKRQLTEEEFDLLRRYFKYD